MRRCIVHQTKWLVLGLLKTTASALATTTTTTSAAAAGTKSWSSPFGGIVSSTSSSSSSATTLPPQRQLPPREPFDQPRPVVHSKQQQQQQQHRSNQSSVSSVSSSSGGSPPPPPPVREEATIVLRLARPSDVRGISTCNLQTLPENYNDQFYLNHLAEWPDLAFVAVLLESPSSSSSSVSSSLSRSTSGGSGGGSSPYHSIATTTTSQQQQPLHSNYQPKSMVPPPQQQQQSNNGFVRNFQARFSFLPYHSSKATVTPSPKVVAYLLGKTCQQQQQYIHYSLAGGGSSSAYEDYGRYTLDSPLQQQQQPLIVGHVSSLAVLPEFRRRGLADSMLEQFHAHLQSASLKGSMTTAAAAAAAAVPSTGLHVRRSNAAAVRLYKKRGYAPAVCIPAYYEDGEDAYYMQKHFRTARSNNNNNGSSGSPLGSNRESLALPRVVGGRDDDEYGVPQLLRATI